jgi:polyphosphate kinase
VTIGKCPNVKHVNLSDNKITKLDIDDELREKVQVLEIGRNQLTDPDIAKKFPNVAELICFDNPIKDGIMNLTIGQKLMFFNGGLTEFNFNNKVSFSAEEDYKKELLENAKELGIDEKELGNKKIDEIKEDIKKKANELKEGNGINKENLEKIKKEFPDLADEDGRLNEDELKKIKENNDKGEGLVKDLEKLGITTAEQVERMKIAIEKLGLTEENLAQIEIKKE